MTNRLENGFYGTRLGPPTEAGPFTVPKEPKVMAVLGTGRIGFVNFYSCATKLMMQRGIALRTHCGLHWDKNVSEAFEAVLKTDADYILAMDNDSVFDVSDFDRLLKFMQEHPELGAVWPVQMTRHMAYGGKPHCYEPFRDYEKEYTVKKFGHFGLTLIRTEMVRKLPQPWLWALPGADGRRHAFDATDGDIYFWRLLDDHGFKVAQHNKVTIGHMELAVIWPDGDKPRLQMIGEYEKQGRPPGTYWTGKPKVQNDTPFRLNLGSGPVHRMGYFSVDRRFGHEVYPLDVPDGSVDEIYASHVLEHFSHRDTAAVLHEWAKKLKPGGVLRVAVPDFRAVVADWIGDKPDVRVEQVVMGAHTDENDVHGALFFREKLHAMFAQEGLVDIGPWESDGRDTSCAPWSLNVQGTRPVVVEDEPAETEDEPDAVCADGAVGA